MDLLVVHPGAQHGIYGALGDRLTALEPPTWARMIAGYCRDRGVDVAVCDAEALALTPEQVAGFVAGQRPSLVAIVVSGHQPSASTQQMTGAGAIARAIKRSDPRQRIIMTGNHPSALPERTMREEAVDFVADGEGPITVYDLLGKLHLPVWDTVPGLVWRRGGLVDPDRIHRNEPPPLIEDLDRDLHGRVWGSLPVLRYRAHNWQMLGRDPAERSPYISLYTSLGCPYRCSFCMINAQFHSNRYRTFSPEFVYEQVRSAHLVYGARTFKIADEMFVLNPGHYLPVCDRLAASGLGDVLNIWAYARVDTVRPENLRRMRAGGIRWLALGIESGNAAIRDGADKALRRNDIVDVVRTIQASGISVIGNFMVGLPGDTVKTMEETYQLAVAANCDFMNVYSTMMYPGSALYSQAAQRGDWTSSDWKTYSQHNRWSEPAGNQTLSPADVLRFRDDFFRRYYSNPGYINTIYNKFGERAVEEIGLMMKYDLPRELLR